MSLYYKENKDYLKEALDSVVNQTVIPTEIVLVKDGLLTKELEETLKLYIEKYPSLFKIILLKENVGLGRALNEGLKMCEYELVARMDTDDIAKKDRFEKQLNVFFRNPNIEVVGSWLDEFECETTNLKAIKKVPEKQSEIIKYAKIRNPLNHPSVMFRKESVIKVGGYLEFPLYEDYYLWVRMLVKGMVFYNIQESLVFFRTSDSMYERRGGIKYLINDMKLQYKFFSLGFLSLIEMVRNIILRSPARIIPNKLRLLFYRKFLRK